MLVVLLGVAAPASAHLGVRPTVHHDGHGSVWVTVTWDDGHPLDAPALATISGYDESGTHVGPTALRALPYDAGTLTYPGTLGTGRWTVTVDVAQPGVGYCEARLTAGPAGSPETVACDAVGAAGGRTRHRASRPVVLAALALVVAATAVVLVRTRPRTRRRR